MAALLGRIGTFTGITNDLDIIRWSHRTDAKFSASGIYRRALSELTVRERVHWKTIWRSMTPDKVKCFSWSVVRGHVLRMKLYRKGISLSFHMPSLYGSC